MLKSKEIHQLGKKARKPKRITKDKGEKFRTASHRCGNTKRNTKYVETAGSCDVMDDSLRFFTIRERDAQAATLTMTVEGKELLLEMNTGVSVTVFLKGMFKEKLGHLKLRPATTSLKTNQPRSQGLSSFRDPGNEVKDQYLDLPRGETEEQGQCAS